MREFTPEHRERLREAAKRRHAEGRNPNLMRGGHHTRGSSHGNWKGDAATLDSRHNTVRRHFVRTGTCIRCGAQPEPVTYNRRDGMTITRCATAWANVSGEYRRDDPEDWIELCYSCHAKMDGLVRNLGVYALPRV